MIDIELLREAGLSEDQIAKILKDQEKKKKKEAMDKILSWSEVKALAERMKKEEIDFTVALKKEGDSVKLTVR